MTEPAGGRRPRAFNTDDPSVVTPPPGAATPGDIPSEQPTASHSQFIAPTTTDLQRGFRWGALFLSAMASLATLAASLAFTSFISTALARQDWIGWTATGLASLAALSALVIVFKELIGISRLSRLGRFRQYVQETVAKPDIAKERGLVGQLKSLLGQHTSLRWGLARLSDHEKDVRDSGELFRLAERELMVPLDGQARNTILKSAKRISMVTALSPFVWIAMIYVLIENLKLLRRLAALYGGKPGFAGSLRLARMVIVHIVATGGMAMTDDVLGQFLGQDLLRRFSRRLGEAAFNGALTARIGAAAVDVIRPLPFLDADPVRARDILPELFKSWTTRGPGK